MTFPTIVAVTASSEANSANQAAYANDKNLTNKWTAAATTGWLAYEASEAFALTGYTIHASNAGGQGSFAPSSWTVEGSNNGSSWTTLDTRTSVPVWGDGEARTYEVSGASAYLHHRINVTANGGGAFLAIGEMYLLHDPSPASSSPYDLAVDASDAIRYYLLQGTGSTERSHGRLSATADATMVGTYTRSSAGLVPNESTDSTTFSGAALSDFHAIIASESTVAVDAVIHPTSLAGSPRNIATVDGQFGAGFQFRVETTGSLSVIWWTPTSGPHTLSSPTGSIVVNETFHVGFEITLTGAALYIDGAQVATSSQAGGVKSSGAGLVIGRLVAGSTSQQFAGRIQKVGVYRSLGAAGFEDHFDAMTSDPLVTFTASSPSSASFEPFGNSVWLAEFPAPAPSDATFTALDRPSFSARARSSAAFDPIGSEQVTYPATTVYFTAPAPSRSLMVPALQPQAPPATITSWPVTVESHTMPALTEAQQTVSKFADYQPLVGTAGRFQIWVDGQPITYLRDVPTIVEDYSSSDPLGDDGARFVCKQIHPWDELGTGDLSMFDMPSDPPVDIAFEDELGNLTHLWDGFLASHGDDTTATDEGRTFTAEGTLKQGAHWPWTPPAYMEPTDPGVVFARAMNSVPNRRYAAFVEVETGLPPITYRGSQSQSILDYALEVLSKMTATDGRQWTTVKVGPRNYQLALNPTLDTYDAAIVKGAEGVDVRLVEDEVTRVDGYFGQGIAPNGGQWGNFFFPGLDLFIPPPYPYNDTTATISVGDTDAGTDTGDGVTVAQRRLVELGYAVAVDGTFNSADAAAVTQMQRDFGLLVDGRIGPQTWSSLFSPGVNEVDLGRIRLPLVSKPWVMEHLYAANGAEIGTNPAWNPKPVPHMPNINFGSDITKAEATVLARKMLEQNGDAVWTGPITLLTDLVAPDGVTPISRFLVREGWRIKVIGHDGDTIVRVGEARKDDLSVSLSVDQRARDALTLDAIAARDRAALRETKPRPGNPSKISALIRDHVTQYEDESKAGKIPAYPVNGNVGLWSVFPIFVSQTGSIAKFELSADNVKTTFSVAFFGKPIQPQVLAGYVSDPIADGSGWRDHYETLVLNHGLIAVYGEPGALGGYAPRVQADGGPITGDLFDDSGFPFESQVGGYLWVAVFASASTIVSGRAFPGVPL